MENSQDGALEPGLGGDGAVKGEPSKKPGTFYKGDPRINRAGGPKRDPSDDQAVPQLLRDLRHVYNRPKSKDKTQGQRMLRTLFETNPEKFLYRFQKAEEEFREAVKRETPPEPAEKVDRGTERSLGLIDQLLADVAKKEAQENADLAARPDAAAIGATLQRKLSESLRREMELQKQVEKLRGRRAQDGVVSQASRPDS